MCLRKKFSPSSPRRFFTGPGEGEDVNCKIQCLEIEKKGCRFRTPSKQTHGRHSLNAVPSVINWSSLLPPSSRLLLWLHFLRRGLFFSTRNAYISFFHIRTSGSRELWKQHLKEPLSWKPFTSQRLCEFSGCEWESKVSFHSLDMHYGISFISPKCIHWAVQVPICDIITKKRVSE